MIFTNKENEKTVLSDGRTIWLSRAVAVVNTVWCITNDEVMLLLGKRGPGCPDEVGKWNLPCGYLDWDETLKEAAERETWEETGVNIKDIKPSNVIINRMDNPWLINSHIDGENKDKQNVSIHHAIVFSSDKLPILTNQNCEPGEISDLKWVKIDDYEKLDYAFNHDLRIKDFINSYLSFALV